MVHWLHDPRRPNPPPHSTPTLDADAANRPADSLLHSVLAPVTPQSQHTATISAPGSQFGTAGRSPTQAQSRMRSSIACVRCRRSKVKCVNNGVGTVCRSCEHAGRDCQYPPPVVATTRRREGSYSEKADGRAYGERRQRPRKSAHTVGPAAIIGSRESPRPMVDALNPGLLTPTVWSELFEIFQLHYSADLPFLHPPTFLKPLRQASMQPPAMDSMPEKHVNVRPPGSDEFLLAFLALTARFHPVIVAHHSPQTSLRPSNPLIASEYYACAANRPDQDGGNQSIEMIQAALMLGLHEWGMCRGFKAWVRIGLAIRGAQAMGLQYEKDLDDEPNSRSIALNSEAARMGLIGADRHASFSSSVGEGNAFIEQEIRRRTFWSCFVMDRYLSSGKYRPQMLHARELRIQLPASERSFLFAEKVRTLMLGEEERVSAGRSEVQSHRQAAMSGNGSHNGTHAPSSPTTTHENSEDDKEGRLEVGADEGLVSRYVRVLEIYGKVVQWSCSGGRRTEAYPPWDPRSEYQKLLHLCQDFKASLPRQHLLSPQNTQAHISMKTQTPYTLVHTVYLLCQIMLHREHVPFIPIRCKKPEGPLDPPLFPKDRYDVPHGFWEDSARQLFQSARSIMDLVQTCQEWNALVETPIVGFAIYTVAFDGVYCINFPWMDPDGYMCTSPGVKPATAGESAGFLAARKALEMIGRMRPRMRMADGWFKTINRMHKYFRRMKADYKKNVQQNDSIASESDGSPTSSRQLSLREGGTGGGLDEFKILERLLTEFGNLEDQDVDMAESTSGSKPLDAVYDDSNSGTTVKSEEGDRLVQTDQAQPDGPWNAINAAPGAPRPAAQEVASNGQFRSYDSFQPQVAPHQQQQQLPPPPYVPAHVNNFRPAYGTPDGSIPPGGPPSLTSPNSRTASTPSQLSPYDPAHQHPQYNTWSQPPPAPYGMHPPPPGLHHSPAGMHQSPPGYAPSHQHPSIPQIHSYPTPGAHAQAMAPPPPMPVAPVWDPMAGEKWLNSIDTRLGGDDVAAFVDGGDMAEWANMAARHSYGGGWLSAVWGGPGGG